MEPVLAGARAVRGCANRCYYTVRMMAVEDSAQLFPLWSLRGPGILEDRPEPICDQSMVSSIPS
ncbi:MAG: hypothetical protein SA339_03895 [Methanomassiliicoccus sp.]|nr:hypothetical protein [Methanomassiliicoccus sp.]